MKTANGATNRDDMMTLGEAHFSDAAVTRTKRTIRQLAAAVNTLEEKPANAASLLAQLAIHMATGVSAGEITEAFFGDLANYATTAMETVA